MADISPAKYTGYDKDGKIVTTRYAENAINYINPTTVKTKANNVSKVMEEQINKIQKALSEIVNDANQALVVNSTKIGPEIEDFIDSLESLKSTASTEVTSVWHNADKAYYTKQRALNDQAYSAVKNTSGVVKVG